MSIISIRCINVIIFCYVCGRLCLQCFFTNKISFSSTPAIVPLRWLKHFNAIFTKLSNINPNFIIWLPTPPIQIGPRGSIRPTPGTTNYPATYPEPPDIGSGTTSHEVVNELIFFVRMNRSQVCLKGKRQTTLFITKICTIYTEKMILYTRNLISWTVILGWIFCFQNLKIFITVLFKYMPIVWASWRCWYWCWCWWWCW